MTYLGRALLAVALLVGFYVFAIGLAVALVAGIVELVTHGVSGALVGKLGIIVVVAIVAIGRGLFTRTKTSDDPGGVLLSEEAEPGLWAEVRELATAAQTRAPDEIRLVAEVNAAVLEDSRLLGLVPGTRRLFLGVPLLIGLSRDQVRSVLAHELGHYSARHTALTPLTYRGAEAIARVRENLGHTSLLGRLVGAYGAVYDRVSFSVKRRQELEADQLSARLVGREAAASALGELGGVGAVWQHFVEDYSGLGGDDLRPAHLFDGFAALVTDPVVRGQMDRIRAEALEPPRSPYDSHPPRSERIAAIRSGAAPDVVAASDPTERGTTLLDHPGDALRLLESRIYAGGSTTPEDWDTLADSHYRATGEAAAVWLSRLLSGHEQPRTLRSVVGRLDAAGATGLLDGVESEEDVARDRAAVSRAVADTTAALVVAARRGDFRISWGSTSGLVDPSGVEIPIRVASAIEAGGGAALLRALEEGGVDVDEELPEPLPSPVAAPVTSAKEDEVLGCLFTAKGWRGRPLVVTHRELLVRTPDFADRRAVGVGSVAGYATSDVQAGPLRMLRRVSGISVAAMEAEGRSEVIPWSSIESVVVTSTRRRSIVHNFDRVLRMSIIRTDGETQDLTFGSKAAAVGSPFEAMQHYLGERYRFIDQRKGLDGVEQERAVTATA